MRLTKADEHLAGLWPWEPKVGDWCSFHEKPYIVFRYWQVRDGHHQVCLSSEGCQAGFRIDGRVPVALRTSNQIFAKLREVVSDYNVLVILEDLSKVSRLQDEYVREALVVALVEALL